MNCLINYFILFFKASIEWQDDEITLLVILYEKMIKLLKKLDNIKFSGL